MHREVSILHIFHVEIQIACEWYVLYVLYVFILHTLSWRLRVYTPYVATRWPSVQVNFKKVRGIEHGELVANARCKWIIRLFVRDYAVWERLMRANIPRPSALYVKFYVCVCVVQIANACELFASSGNAAYVIRITGALRCLIIFREFHGCIYIFNCVIYWSDKSVRARTFVARIRLIFLLRTEIRANLCKQICGFYLYFGFTKFLLLDFLLKI